MKQQTKKTTAKILCTVAVCTLLTACGGNEEKTAEKNIPAPEKNRVITESNLLSQISEARDKTQKNEKSASLVLTSETTEDGKEIVSLVLQNPQEKPLQSVRSFLAFPAEMVEVENVEIHPESPFQIVAPGEQNADNKNGMVKIGVSIAEGKQVTAKEITIANITFVNNTESSALIDFYRSAEGNETAVYQKGDDELQDILLEPSSPALLLFSE